MSIIDSHCHLQYPTFDEDRDAMIQRALDAGVQMICIGTDLKSSKTGVEIAQKFDGVWAVVGLHPNDNMDEVFDVVQYASLLDMPKVVGIGEMGLDYYRTTEPAHRKIQKDRFEQQLDLAVKRRLPIVIHSRDAGKGSTGVVHPDVIAVLKNNTPDRKGVAHSFTGTVDEARTYLDMGFYLGFNGIITFARQYDELVRFVPLDRILLETDAPFLAPELYRGKRNESAYVIEVAKKVADLKGQAVDNVITTTTHNTRTLFALDSVPQ